MEIELDVPTVRDIIADEHALAAAQLQSLGPIAAYEQSQMRHDTRLANAADAHTLACKTGCFWCCFFSVDVRPVEVFRILQFMEGLAVAERQRIGSELAANSTLLASMDEEQRARHNIKCPFLAQGRCQIYAARPQTCRNYHATNAAGCQRSFEHPEDVDIDPEFAPLTYQIGAAHVDGFAMAMLARGYDHAAYELNAALAQVLLDPEQARQRFEAGQAPFTGLTGTQVPLEFEDLSPVGGRE